MAYLEGSEVYKAYKDACDEADIWREDYPEFERLMNNGLMDDLDETLPEVNDGSLAASLFKLPKRIISSDLHGRAKAVDADEAWLTELANMQWDNEIVPNANSQAPFHRKWKDAVRKSAGYGGQPIVNLFVTRGNYTGSDFIVPYAQDVKLEAGKVSDYDCDIIFWDVYYSKLQWKNMIEQAEEEMAEQTEDGYNKWNLEVMREILANAEEEERPGDQEPSELNDKGVKRGGIHCYIAFQRGVEAPFMMCHPKHKDVAVREWSNPDPTGDVPVHYLYCYQDFVNPYGIGIVKLAGGTQNVLDYMRQADVKATQLGLDPPLDVHGDADSADLDSLVNEQKALWFTGNATVTPVQIANTVYQELPNRQAMYKTSLNQLIPTGDTSISAEAGDPNYSKTPAGVKFQQQSLSIDDEDFKDNLYQTYNAVAKSMINTHFANMQGTDLMKLSDEQRDILQKAGLEFPVDEMGQPTNELEVIWDEARATFDFEVDAEQDKTSDDAQKLEGLLNVAKFAASDPTFDQQLMQSGKKLNRGELFADIVNLTSDNDKIIEDIGEEDQQQMQESMGQQTEPEKKPSDSITYRDAVETGAIDAAAAMLQEQGLPADGLVQSAEQQAMAQEQQMAMEQEQMALQNQPVEEEPTGLLNDPRIDDYQKRFKVDPDIAAQMATYADQGYPEEDVMMAGKQMQDARNQEQVNASA